MGTDAFEIGVNFVKMVAIFLMMVQIVPLLVWVERRGSAYIQNRFGPNRVGPLGLMQLLADAVKFLTKEEFIPARGYPALFYKKAFDKNEQWPNPREYSDYQLNMRLREAPLDWGLRVPKLKDRLPSSVAKPKEQAKKSEE